MRRIGIPVVLALATAGFTGIGDSSTARKSLDVGVDCWTEIGSTLCDAIPMGGTGTYISYSWTVDEFSLNTGLLTTSYQVSGTNPQLSSSCIPDHHVVVTVTVMDSNGATAVGNSGFSCSPPS